MKRAMRLFSAVLVLLLFLLPCGALEEEAPLPADNSWLGEVLGEDGAAAIDSVVLLQDAAPTTVLQWIWESFSARASGLAPTVGLLLALLLAAFLCRSFFEGGEKETLSFAFSVLFALVLGEAVMAALRAVCAYLERLFVLLSSFSVVSAGLYIAGGNELTAAASAAGLSVTLSALSGAASEIMAPAIGIFYCLGLSAAISGVSVFEGLAKLFKNTIQFALGGLCTVFCAMLVLQQQLAQSKDGIGARTVRFVLARSVPLVGGALSEAVRTVIGGVGAAKSIVGSGGILAVFAVALAPLLLLFLYLWLFSAGKSLCASFSLGRCGAVFEQSAAAITLLLAADGFFTVVALLHMILFLCSGTARGGIL